ncbi:DUF998 domain-containing protein [Amycolatopsis sp. FDAARGOS 1241]|uniref:DUF998 domain-containing protein n=1 Tax=Amycolatopsis sp. FDAARGOS 1241 TaxID=2778070 RepID=UPI00194EACB9|nr:DUF998 domain-containing protein [Amycolatopsis sp. FDAARGOS 1241]QRP47547.1 DUF998 domain-containing protein [Amycolatopsis sp. FDAARGOS 1241]
MTTTAPATTAVPTRTLRACGLAAGPVYVATALAQALTREGFDPLHDDVSYLALGPLGWIQITNFVVTGLLTIAAAAGLRRTQGRRPAILITAFGAGLIAAGIFAADPVGVSWHGVLHLVTAGIGFLAFTGACFAVQGSKRFRRYSRATGVVFLTGFLGVASGSTSPAVVLGFWAAVVLAFTWLAVTSNTGTATH